MVLYYIQERNQSIYCVTYVAHISLDYVEYLNLIELLGILKRYRDNPPLPEVMEAGSKRTIKRTRQVQYPELDTVLFDWFLRFERQVPMSGELIKEKAVLIFKALYPEQQKCLKFSNGWLCAWKERNGIKEFRKHGESGDVDMKVVENNLPMLRNTLGVYRQNDIYNMDETAFFYQLIPDRSLATQLWEGGKQSKHRMTVVVCTNAIGTDKIPLWFIGKHLHPRCLKNINMNHLGCRYVANKKAWMTGELFREWLKWFGQRIGTDRQIVLLLDNFSGHAPGDTTPSNIKIVFLPPNTTSKLQPCDQGIIHTLKAHTRRAILRSLLDFTDKYPTLESRQYTTRGGSIRVYKFAPDVLKAMTLMTSAWQTVTSTTITNCFHKAGIRHQDRGLLAFDDPLTEVTDLLDVITVDMARVRPRHHSTLATDVQYFVSPIEEDIEEGDMEVTLEQLLEPYQPLVIPEEDDSEVPPTIWGNEARDALALLKLYVQQQWDPGMLSLICDIEDETAIAIQKDLHSLERHISVLQLRKARHQTSITSFFQPSQDSGDGSEIIGALGE